MDSSTSRTEDSRRKQEEILKEIAALQAKLKDLPQEPPVNPVLTPTSPKRKQPDSATLVPPTPSPKKRKVNQHPPRVAQLAHAGPADTPKSNSSRTALPRKVVEPLFTKPEPSNLLKNLAKATREERDSARNDHIARSSGFTEKPPALADREGDEPFESSSRRRDDRLALVEDFKPGPIDHTPPPDDPNFDKLEPNSGIALSARTTSHEDLQEYLTGRFYLAPSQLYSNIRLLPDKTGYDVPVPGDWITIAVVAERGPVKFSKAPVAVGREEGDEDGKKQKWKDKGKATDEPAKPTGKKYVNFKLIDFGSRSRSSSSATGGKTVIRGDAFLSLLLFESDSFDLVSEDGVSKPRKVYKGGSRGAFESMSKVKEGDVIALLNPRILKPYQRSNDNPHPVTNILAVTPENASSIITIGRARDLGMCAVLKRDNSVCGSWVDKRVSDVCEYHVQHAVERRRAGRAEFSIGTMGMSTTSAPKRKPAYDPARQWGLAPEPVASSASYIVSGHIVNDSKFDSRSLFDTENIGREGQAKAARRLAKKADDRALMNLLERDKEGMKVVMKAKEAIQRAEDAKGKGKAKNKGEKGAGKETDKLGKKEQVASTTSKNAYTAEVIKHLGFDPITMSGQHRGAADSNVQKKLRTLETLQSSRKEIALGPRPGPRIRSGVVAPSTSTRGVPEDGMVDLDD
ncbi:hypothetical protein H0H92_009644 [Tricholoma furcatifolium]|nr:hypothetical protein H0H92_009644 [Tricholoma furcatifolium]